jgi:predicted dehydrogenase
MPSRRQFLATTAALTAASMLSSRVRGQGSPTGDDQKKLGWALVGIGNLTEGQILPALANCSGSRLAALVTGHPDKAKPIIARFGLDPGAVYSYDTYDKLVDNPAVQVIYIVLPNGMHAEYTIRGLRAGKHVLCEKPMANSVADCQQMIDAAKSAGKKLMVAYRVRREPHNMKAIDICRGGQIGKPRFIFTSHGFQIPPGVWRTNLKLAGGGALLDVGIYGINASRYLSGEEPVSVMAQRTDNTNDPRFAQVEEAMAWTLQFPSGLLASGTTSYNIAGTNHIRITGSSGALDMEPATNYHGNNLTRRINGDRHDFDLPDIDQFVAQMDYFSDCVRGDKDPITPGEEGLRDLRIIEAIYESAAMGKRVNLAEA